MGDLLNGDSDKYLEIRENPTVGIYVQDLKEELVTNY